MEKIKAAVTIESTVSRSSKSSSSAMTSSSSASAAAAALSVPDTRIRTVKPAEYKAAAACLAEAFATDDVAAYFFDCPDTADWSAERKWTLHLKLMEYIVYAHACFGLVHAIGSPTAKTAAPSPSDAGAETRPDARTVPPSALSSIAIESTASTGCFDAVALWMPPGTSISGRMGLSSLRRQALWWLLQAQVRAQLSREGRERMFREFFPLLHLTKEAVLKERDPEAWYLVYLGTHSRARGRGLAKKLVNEINRKADAESRACYLESSNKANLPLYRKLGFETCRTIDLERDSKKVSMDVMVREPIAKVKNSRDPAPATGLASLAPTTIVIEESIS